MARKKDISYFTDINSDEELERFLKQDALIILDVYQELLGPCTIGLHGSIERIKIALPESDALQLGSANATKINKLKRFHGKSLPTMLFCRSGKCVDIVYGSDVPSVAKKVEKHLSMKQFGDDDKTGRYFFDFDEMVGEERDEYERKLAIEQEAYRIKHEAEMIVKYAELDEVIGLMKKNAAGTGVTLYMPHVAETGYRKTHETSKWSSIVQKAMKIVQLTPELMEILNYRLENPLDDVICDYIYGKDILAVLWFSTSRTPVTKVLKTFIESVTEPQPMEDEEGNRISGAFKPAILNSLRVADNGEEYEEIIEITMERNGVPIGEDKEENVENEKLPSTIVGEDENVMNEDEDEGEDQMEEEIVEKEPEKELIIEGGFSIPPMWTPANQPGNAVLMYTFFRNQFDSFLPQLPEEEAPHLCVIFPAKKHQQVFEICQNYQKFEVMAFGFFKGDDLANLQILARTVLFYEKLTQKKNSDKLIMKIMNETDHLLLALAELSPTYVSTSHACGKEDCANVFNESFYAERDSTIIERKSERKSTSKRNSGRRSQERRSSLRRSKKTSK